MAASFGLSLFCMARPTSYPHTHACAHTQVEVRGEVYLAPAALIELNAERLAEGLVAFSNPRNAAAGTIRQSAVLDRAGPSGVAANSAVAALQFYAYELVVVSPNTDEDQRLSPDTMYVCVYVCARACVWGGGFDSG